MARYYSIWTLLKQIQMFTSLHEIKVSTLRMLSLMQLLQKAVPWRRFKRLGVTAAGLAMKICPAISMVRNLA